MALATPFDPGQRAAAHAIERTVIVRGGPGTGRTHSLLGRVHHLLSQREPHNNLCVWLAHPYLARDFRRRFEETAPDQADPPRISIGTVHQAAFGYLRMLGESIIGRNLNFTIWNRQRAAAEMKRHTRLVMTKSHQEEQIEREVVRILNWYIRNRNRYRQGPQLQAQRREWHEVVGLYEGSKRIMDAWDLEDLVSEAVRGLEADPRRDQRLRLFCRNLIVDDFQEMTALQYHFFRLCCGQARTVTVSVDPQQALGTALGADVGVPELFALDHTEHMVYHLELDHRSTEEISAIGRALRNSDMMPALSRTSPTREHRAIRPNRERPVLVDFSGTKHQLLQFVLDEAESSEAEGQFSWDEMAIISFQDRISTDMLTELARRQIPFTMQGPTDRQGLDDAKRLLTIISLLVRPHDRSALVDIIVAGYDDYRGSRRSTLDAGIARICDEEDMLPIEACARLLDRGLITSARTRFAVEQTLATYRFLEQRLEDNAQTIAECLRMVCELFQGQWLGRPATGAASHMAELLLSGLEETGPPSGNRTVGDIIFRLLPVWDLGEYNGVPRREGLTVATVAAAAGSEWRSVWLIDASDHLIPRVDLSKDGDETDQEERRFYTASTRAADRLFYCNARGGGLGFEAKPSRYIDVLGDLVEHREIDPGQRLRSSTGSDESSVNEDDPGEVQP